MSKTILAICILLTACATTSDPGLSTDRSPKKQANDGNGGYAQVLLCRDQLGRFADRLQELDSRLSVGLVFAAYSEQVGDARVEYDKLPIGEFQAPCLRNAGIPRTR